MEVGVEVVPSTKEKRNLYRIGGFLFEVEKTRLDTLYCRCLRMRHEACPMRAILDKESDIVRVKKMGTQGHNHQADEKLFIKRSVSTALKNAVVTQADRGVKRVYTEQLMASVPELRQKFDDETVGIALPVYDGMRTILHRKRAQLPPVLPRSRSELHLEAPWTTTTNGDEFLVINEGTENRILGFTTPELVAAMCAAPVLFMDGTFGIVPNIFEQLYTIHGFYRGQMIPLALFLLPDKSGETYQRMLSLLREFATSRGFVFNPRTFQIDYEVAVMRAIQLILPTAEIKGCWFHFSQCLWRKWQSLGLTADEYSEDDNVQRVFRSVKSLALVPLNMIDDAWLELSAESPEQSHEAFGALEDFKQYVINTWLENENVFPRPMWNHYRNFGARTTNHLEGWHRAMNVRAGKKHLNIFEMITILKEQEAQNQTSMIQLRMAQAPPRKCTKYEKINRALMKLVTELEGNEIELLDYMHAVGHNL